MKRESPSFSEHRTLLPLCIVYESNKEAFIAVNTPFGQTPRVAVQDIEMQGTKITPIKAAIQIDSLGKQCLEKNENLYTYKKLHYAYFRFCFIQSLFLIFLKDFIIFSQTPMIKIGLSCVLCTKIMFCLRAWFVHQDCHLNIDNSRFRYLESDLSNEVSSRSF